MKKTFLEHSYYLNIIKRILKASFVGWIEEKGNKSLRVIIKGKDHLIPLEGGEIGHETYTDLIKNLLADGEV